MVSPPKRKRAAAPSFKTPRTAKGVARVPAVAVNRGTVRAPFRVTVEKVPRAELRPKRAQEVRVMPKNCLGFMMMLQELRKK